MHSAVALPASSYVSSHLLLDLGYCLKLLFSKHWNRLHHFRPYEAKLQVGRVRATYKEYNLHFICMLLAFIIENLIVFACASDAS